MKVAIGSQVRCDDGLIGIVIGYVGPSYAVWASDTNVNDPWLLNDDDFTVIGNALRDPVGPPQVDLKQLKVVPGATVEVGSLVRIDSPKNYSYHGLVGKVEKITYTTRGYKAHVQCLPGQSRTGFRTPTHLLEVVK